jgi:phage portal protein BeeE
VSLWIPGRASVPPERAVVVSPPGEIAAAQRSAPSSAEKALTVYDRWKAGPVGPGAAVLNTEFPLQSILGGNDPSQKIRKLWQLGMATPWIRAAERVISGTCSTVEWHLEDDEDQEIDEDNGDTLQQQALALMEKPQAQIPVGSKLTRRELWALTIRHMGLTGNAFWYMDQMSVVGGLPAAILYIRPDRLTPNEDKAGNLLSWQLDRSPKSAGLEVPLDRLIHFKLDPPDTGHYGVGLVEAAMLKAQNSMAEDQHLAMVLSSGGRLAGLLSPKDGESLDDGQYLQLVNDARTVVEQPDAAKRLQILRGPVDFTPTTMTIKDLNLVAVMTMGRDDLLTIWGVPLSQIGGTPPGGLNSGESHKYDRQALWENANHPRLVAFGESVQYQLLDRWAQVQRSSAVEIEIEEPEFVDDGVRFDLLLKSLNTPLRNWERRELIGKPPFGPDALNPSTGQPIDDEVWLPSTQANAYPAVEDTAIGETGPSPDTGAVPGGNQNVDEPGDQAAVTAAAGETRQSEMTSNPSNATVSGKAGPVPQASGRKMQRVLRGLRSEAEDRTVPVLKDEVGSVLKEQQSEIVQRALAALPHLLANPGDEQAIRILWDDVKWNRRMTQAMAPALTRMATGLDAGLRQMLGRLPEAGFEAKAGPVGAVTHALRHAGTKITGLNDRTRDSVLAVVRETVSEAIDLGSSVRTAGDVLEAALNSASLVNGTGLWDEYRSEMIARTEMTEAYNSAALGSYSDMQVEQVQAIDGDDDPECAERDGETFSIDEADAIEDHPNGTLDWIPVV